MNPAKVVDLVDAALAAHRADYSNARCSCGGFVTARPDGLADYRIVPGFRRHQADAIARALSDTFQHTGVHGP